MSKNTITDTALLTASAVILRLALLGNESFWIDEMATFERISMGWREMMETIISLRYHGPLQYILAKLSCEVFGFGEFGARLPSAVFGAAAVPLFYLTLRRLCSRGAAFVAGALLACSTYHLAFSQEARFYGVMGFFTCASMYFFLRLIQDRSISAASGYVLTTSLMLYNHYYGVFIILAQNLLLLSEPLFLKNKRIVMQWAGIQTATAILFVPWLLVVFRGVSKYTSDYKVLEVPGILNLLAAPWYFAGKQTMLAVLFAVVLIAFILTALRKERFSFRIKTALIWIAVPLLVPFAISVTLTPVYSGRYILSASFGLYLAAAILYDIHGSRIRKILTITLTLASLAAIFNYYRFPDNEQWKETAAYVETNRQPGDVVILHPAFNRRAYNFYAGSNEAKGFPLFKQKLKGRGPEISIENANLIDEQSAGAERVWLVFCHSYDEDNLLYKHLCEGYRLAEEKDFHKIEILLFEKPDKALKH